MSGLAAGLAGAVLAAAAAAPPPAGTASPPRGELIVSLEATELSAGGEGGGGAVDWVRRAADGRVLAAGLASYRLGESRWTVGKLAGAARPRPRTTVTGELRLGPGRTGGRGFTYQAAVAGLAFEVAPKRLYLHLEDEYLDVDRARGNLLKAGFTLLPAAAWSTRLSYLRSTGGNLGTELVAGRLDLDRGRWRALAGFARGRSRPEIFNLLQEGGRRQRLQEVFAGFGRPLDRGELLLALDHLDTGAGRRWTLTASLRLPPRAGGGEGER